MNGNRNVFRAKWKNGGRRCWNYVGFRRQNGSKESESVEINMGLGTKWECALAVPGSPREPVDGQGSLRESQGGPWGSPGEPPWPSCRGRVYIASSVAYSGLAILVWRFRSGGARGALGDPPGEPPWPSCRGRVYVASSVAYSVLAILVWRSCPGGARGPTGGASKTGKR